MTDLITKKYYTIGEVAEMIGEAPSLLRFWEKEFDDFLKPDKTQGGTRKYHTSDIETVRLIHYYVKIKGYTLKGAKEALQRKSKTDEKEFLMNRLFSIREFLVKLSNNLRYE